MIDIFTSIATNYIPKARVLARSVKKYHPEIRMHMVIVDKIPENYTLTNEPFDSIIPVEQLQIPEWDKWLFMHTIVEACTAVKPFAFQYILSRYNSDALFYFDPDIAIFSSIEPLLKQLETYDILLTPHLCKPEASYAAIEDNELAALQHGLYNLGFLGLRNSSESKALLHWWQERLYHWCYNDIPRGIFTDQKWMDLVPIFFKGVKILLEPVYNVATWNYAQRALAGSLEEGITVDGQPLCFHHFTGYDSGAHAKMLAKYGAHMPAAMALSAWYKQACNEAEQDVLSAYEWTYKRFDNGVEILPVHRKIYRVRKDLQEAFPHPFATAAAGTYGSSYYAWLQQEGQQTLFTISSSDVVVTQVSLNGLLQEIEARITRHRQRYHPRLHFLRYSILSAIRWGIGCMRTVLVLWKQKNG